MTKNFNVEMTKNLSPTKKKRLGHNIMKLERKTFS